MSLQRKKLNNINDENLKNVNGAKYSEHGDYWEVRDDITNRLIGKYSTRKYAKFADELYKEDGKRSAFGYISED